MKPTAKKLSLSAETLRVLHTQESEQVQGAALSYQQCSKWPYCLTNTICRDTCLC